MRHPSSIVRGASALLLIVALTGCSAGVAVDTSSHDAGEAAGAMTHGSSRTVSSGPVEVLPGDEARTVLGAITAMFAAYDEKNLGRWLGSWTDRGYLGVFGVDKAEAALVPPSWGDVRAFRESRVELTDVVSHGKHELPKEHRPAEPNEHGRGEHAVIETLEAGILTRQRLDLVEENGRWRVDGRTVLPTEAKGEILEVTLTEHRMDLSATEAGRNPVLRARNLGDTTHEVLLLRDRGGQDETVGRTGPLRPGETRDLVGRDLPAGSYMLVCNELTAEGTPHSALGMRALLDVA